VWRSTEAVASSMTRILERRSNARAIPTQNRHRHRHTHTHTHTHSVTLVLGHHCFGEMSSSLFQGTKRTEKLTLANTKIRSSLFHFVIQFSLQPKCEYYESIDIDPPKISFWKYLLILQQHFSVVPTQVLSKSLHHYIL
jgi:hypothetical protein